MNETELKVFKEVASSSAAVIDNNIIKKAGFEVRLTILKCNILYM